MRKFNSQGVPTPERTRPSRSHKWMRGTLAVLGVWLGDEVCGEIACQNLKRAPYYILMSGLKQLHKRLS